MAWRGTPKTPWEPAACRLTAHQGRPVGSCLRMSVQRSHRGTASNRTGTVTGSQEGSPGKVASQGRAAGVGGVCRQGIWGCRAWKSGPRGSRRGQEVRQGQGHPGHRCYQPHTDSPTQPAPPQTLDQRCGPGEPQSPQSQTGLRAPRGGALGPGGNRGSLHPALSPTMSWAWPFWKEPPESPLPSSWRSTTRHFTASWT